MKLGVSSSQELFDLIPIVGIYAWDDISKYFKNNFTKKDDKNYNKRVPIERAQARVNSRRVSKLLGGGNWHAWTCLNSR